MRMLPMATIAGCLLAVGSSWADEAPVVVDGPVMEGHVVYEYPAVAPAPVFTYADACCHLRALPPGPHRITVIHPYTCCPVDVCFCLPCGCYELVCGDGLFASKLRFKYKGLCNDIVIKFTKNGSVVVKD